MASGSSGNHRSKTCNNFLDKFQDLETDNFRELTSDEFLDVWAHYDKDENGYIDGKELDCFFRDLTGILEKKDTRMITAAQMTSMRQLLLESLDANEDGRIEITELASLLPTEENFVRLFRSDKTTPSSVQFMRIWRHFDKDSNGYIDVSELMDFIKEVKLSNDQSFTDKELRFFAKSMLRVFDKNKDGKLQLSEMARLLPTEQNHLRPLIFKKGAISEEELDRVFQKYDRNKNNFIENDELEGFFKDLMDIVSKDYELAHVRHMKDQIMKKWDLDQDGKINRSELRMLLQQQNKMAMLEEASRPCTPQCSLVPTPAPSATTTPRAPTPRIPTPRAPASRSPTPQPSH